MKVLSFLKYAKDQLSLWLNLMSCFGYDFKYFYRVSNIKRLRKTKDQKLGSIIGSYHIIEKGLSMPKRRLGFGIPAVSNLIDECNDYYKEFGNDNSQFAHAVQVVYEYEELHRCNHFKLPQELTNKIKNLHSLVALEPSHQKSLSKEDFFLSTNASFDIFSSSRHSTRHFDGPADKSSVLKAIDLAQNAPSSCNKQPTMIHYVTNSDTVKEILIEQRGNRGFGQDIGSLIVLTTNMSCYSQVGERRSGFVDLGIYTMNLLYALHFYKIGAIPLIWLSDKKRDTWLMSKLGGANNEIPVLIIGLGNVSETPSLVNSPRKDLKEVLIIHE